MSTYASSGKPPYAVTMWADDNAVFMELPCKDGPPYITSYPFSDAGLSKALGMMRELYRKDAHPTMLVVHPKIAGAKANQPASVAQRALALRILKARGIV